MMICPKCDHEQNAEDIECVKCGLIFAKYRAAQISPSQGNPPGPTESAPPDAEERFSMMELFFHTNPDNNLLFIGGRAAVFILIIVWGFRFMAAPLEQNYAGESFMHLVNLPFHEAGHIVFGFLGNFVASLGGTLGQFLMPLICFAVLLLKTRDTFGASVVLWWFGQNFFDIAPYINDARSLTLPLLGGNTGHSAPYGFHDWEYLLTESGLLRYDHFIAKSCLAAGMAIFLVSFVWGGILLYKQYRDLYGPTHSGVKGDRP